MSKCVKCNKLYSPDYMIVENDINAPKCIFCVTKKNDTLIERDNGQFTKYTKEQANKDYMKFLRILSENPKIAKNLVDKGVNELIKEGR